MDDYRETAEELERLRALTPPPEWARDLRARVFARIEAEPVPPLETLIPSPYHTPSFWHTYRTALVSLCVLVLTITAVSHDRLYAEALLLQSTYRVHAGDTAADRSRAALDYVQTATARLETSDDDALDAAYTKVAVERAQTELGKLQLMGEAGKYTQADCRALYQEYDRLLETLTADADQKLTQAGPTADTTLVALAQTLTAAHDEAARRINLYPEDADHEL